MPALEVDRALQAEGTASLQRGRAWHCGEASGMRGEMLRDVAGMAAGANPSPTCVLHGVAWIVLCR